VFSKQKNSSSFAGQGKKKAYRKIGGAGCITCSPNNFVGGATATPVPAPMVHEFVRSFVTLHSFGFVDSQRYSPLNRTQLALVVLCFCNFGLRSCVIKQTTA